jgi:hypothetical protein
MKNILAVLLLIFSCFSLYGQGMTLEEARAIYAESMKDKVTCEAAYNKISKVPDSENNVLIGYKAAITIAMSKHQKNTKEKIASFTKGKQLLEGAISKDDKNVELKFIRFTIQSNCPPALKYNKNITNDKTYIITNLTNVKNISVRKRIKEYLLQSKDLSADEKIKLNGIQ